jgi:hypothetical protein
VSCSCILEIFYRESRTPINKDIHGHNAHPRAIRLEHKNTSKADIPQTVALNSSRVRSCDGIGSNLTSVILILQQKTSRRLSGEHSRYRSDEACPEAVLTPHALWVLSALVDRANSMRRLSAWQLLDPRSGSGALCTSIRIHFHVSCHCFSRNHLSVLLPERSRLRCTEQKSISSGLVSMLMPGGYNYSGP